MKTIIALLALLTVTCLADDAFHRYTEKLGNSFQIVMSGLKYDEKGIAIPPAKAEDVTIKMTMPDGREYTAKWFLSKADGWIAK